MQKQSIQLAPNRSITPLAHRRSECLAVRCALELALNPLTLVGKQRKLCRYGSVLRTAPATRAAFSTPYADHWLKRVPRAPQTAFHALIAGFFRMKSEGFLLETASDRRRPQTMGGMFPRRRAEEEKAKRNEVEQRLETTWT